MVKNNSVSEKLVYAINIILMEMALLSLTDADPIKIVGYCGLALGPCRQ